MYYRLFMYNNIVWYLHFLIYIIVFQLFTNANYKENNKFKSNNCICSVWMLTNQRKGDKINLSFTLIVAIKHVYYKISLKTT